MRYFIYVAFITMADVNDVKVRSEIQVGIFDNGNYFSMWTQKLHAINMSIIKALALMLGWYSKLFVEIAQMRWPYISAGQRHNRFVHVPYTLCAN